RFDGYQFTSYTTDQGLPHNWVNDLLETRGGAYWVATGAGVCRFNPAGSPLFVPYIQAGRDASLSAGVLIEDQSGAGWCGTGMGVFRLDETPGERRFLSVDLGMPTEGEGNVVQTALADRQRSLWFGTRTSGLYRRWPDGRVDHYT